MKIFENILKKIAHFQVSFPFITLFFLLGFTIIILGGVSQVKTVASLEQMMPSTIEEIEAFNTLRDSQLGKDSIVVILSVDENTRYQQGITDIRDQKIISYLEELEEALYLETEILNIQSLASTQNEKRFLSQDLKTTILIVDTDLGRDDTRMNLLVEKIKGIIEDKGHPPGVKISYTGTPIIQQTLGELVNNDRVNTQWISLLFVFIITAIVFRSLSSAIIPILIVFLSINWLYGTMGYAGLPISTLAGGVAAMVVGIGIDFAIHIMNKFKYERKSGLSIPDAIEMTVVHTGTALIATSLTTIGAFLAFFVGVMPEMGRFGLLMAIGIFYALVFSVFGLPALLVIEEKVIYYVKKKFKFGLEKEFHLEGGGNYD